MALAAIAQNISARRGLDFRLESADRQQEGTDPAPMRLSSPDYRGPGGLLLGLTAAAGERQLQRHLPPTITKAHDAHNLTSEQAAQGYPVRLRVIVTYYDPYNDPRRPACFAADSSGGIYVDLRALPAIPFRAGDFVEITGITATGGYAPIVVATEARLVGKSHFPSIAPRVTLSEILTGAYDGQ